MKLFRIIGAVIFLSICLTATAQTTSLETPRPSTSSSTPTTVEKLVSEAEKILKSNGFESISNEGGITASSPDMLVNMNIVPVDNRWILLMSSELKSYNGIPDSKILSAANNLNNNIVGLKFIGTFTEAGDAAYEFGLNPTDHIMGTLIASLQHYVYTEEELSLLLKEIPPAIISIKQQLPDSL